MAKVSIIGSGFAGLSAAAVLAKDGHEVTLFEKNASSGGRARSFTEKGFTFDMGPSWYWMPEVFEKYFNRFNYQTSDLFTLKQLDPGFTMIFGDQDAIKIPANHDALCELFESCENGSSLKLKKFLKEAAFKYDTGMNRLVYKPGHSMLEFVSFDLLKSASRLDIFRSLRSHVRSYFKDPRLIALMEFPVLFLGAAPQQIPALYSLMNHAALNLGTWYPMGGFAKVAAAFERIALESGVTIRNDSPVSRINTKSGRAKSLTVNEEEYSTDGVIASADYHHVESNMLAEKDRTYSSSYWQNRSMSPSCLIFYLGVKGRVEQLDHHNLFFDADMEVHSNELYKDIKWPSTPLFYVCAPSRTDSSVAPDGDENLFVLIPVAAGLADSDEVRESFFDPILSRIEKYIGSPLRNKITYKRSYSLSNFTVDYNAFKGNAYGLANTLMQTAMFKPKMQSRKVSNLFFAGQLTTPGPGIPPAIISGQVAAATLNKHFKRIR